jgi:probable rRNA maturation factor
MINLFNSKKLLKKFPKFAIDEIKTSLEKEFDLDSDINIIFVSKGKIRKLNKKFRSKDEVTDVLSFNIDSDDLLGEIYICPKYIIKTTKREDIKDQIIRIIIHGILHLQGFNHKKKFDKVDYKDEPMYIRQEEILNKILIKE